MSSKVGKIEPSIGAPDNFEGLGEIEKTDEISADPELDLPNFANAELILPDSFSVPGNAEKKKKSAAGELVVVKGNQIKPEPVEWLWENWIAAGKIQMIAGEAGTAKTTLAIKLAADLTCGNSWPDGKKNKPADVAIWSGEDGIEDTILPRFIQAGGDTSRLHFPNKVEASGCLRQFHPSDHIGLLETYLSENPGIKLLIIDPIVSMVSGTGHSNAEVRRDLQPLVDLAGRTRCAVLGITHFNKFRGLSNPIERISGSIAFGAITRILMIVVRGVSEGERYLLRAQSNVGPDDGGFRFELIFSTLDGHPDITAAIISWRGHISGTAKEIMAELERQNNKNATAMEDATQFLIETLAGGPRSQKELMEEARARGISEKTLRRAKKALAVESNGPREGGWFWKMPNKGGHDLPMC